MDGASDSEESTYSGNGESNISMDFGNKSDQDAFVFQRIMEALFCLCSDKKKEN
jgi:hypothetical protein